MSNSIEVPLTAHAYLGVTVQVDGNGIAERVLTGLYVHGLLLSSASVQPELVCMQENPNNFSDQPISESHRQSFDFDCGDACFYLGKDAADLICDFLKANGVAFADFRDLVSYYHSANETSGQIGGSSTSTILERKMTKAKPSFDTFTINDDPILLEIDSDRTLTAVIYGDVVGNTHVELAAREIETDGECGVTLTGSGLSFGRSSVWLACKNLDAVAEFLKSYDFSFSDYRNAANADDHRPRGNN